MDAFADEIRSLSPQLDLSRRGAVLASLAAGFALAAQPVAAQSVITADTNGLEAGEVRIPTADGEIPAYRAMPAGAGPFPVVLVVQEIFGVHEHIKDMCRRFAKLGHMAIAPELYARQGDVSKIADIPTIQREVVSKVPDAQVMSDAQLEELLAGQPEAIQDEILSINTDARDLALQVALLVALLASLVGVVNAFRMMRLPDPAPSAAAEAMVLG